MRKSDTGELRFVAVRQSDASIIDEIAAGEQVRYDEWDEPFGMVIRNATDGYLIVCTRKGEQNSDLRRFLIQRKRLKFQPIRVTLEFPDGRIASSENCTFPGKDTVYQLLAFVIKAECLVDARNKETRDAH